VRREIKWLSVLGVLKIPFIEVTPHGPAEDLAGFAAGRVSLTYFIFPFES
jgi:hypothetical protein